MMLETSEILNLWLRNVEGGQEVQRRGSVGWNNKQWLVVRRSSNIKDRYLYYNWFSMKIKKRTIKILVYIVEE